MVTDELWPLHSGDVKQEIYLNDGVRCVVGLVAMAMGWNQRAMRTCHQINENTRDMPDDELRHSFDGTSGTVPGLRCSKASPIFSHTGRTNSHP